MIGEYRYNIINKIKHNTNIIKYFNQLGPLNFLNKANKAIPLVVFSSLPLLKNIKLKPCLFFKWLSITFEIPYRLTITAKAPTLIKLFPITFKKSNLDKVPRVLPKVRTPSQPSGRERLFNKPPSGWGWLGVKTSTTGTGYGSRACFSVNKTPWDISSLR
uniref:Uncharacterized protein n=1 Tax=Porodaedalea pini TaxID=108901 RepID=A0A5B9RAU0_9AGAM|nr:hypothetical protein PPIT_000063 [Porodaedalea pini]QEG56944.1 hypothetical protein PPIT_000063 [Porodaedalea pini]